MKELGQVSGLRYAYYLNIYNGLYCLEVFSDQASKKEALLKLKEMTGCDQVVVFGDNLNDLPMIETAGIGIAFMAKPIVAERAPYRIKTRDLSLVLEILDQHRKETACISY